MALLAACAEQQPLAGSPDGQLYTRGLSEISDLYIEPVSTRRVALSGAARLSRLDRKIAVSDSFGAGVGGAISLSYEGRDIALDAVPPEGDNRAWGALIATLVATAKQASPTLVALPQDAIDKAVFDGMTAALDPFSRYSDPAVARDQRAARDGYGGVGINFDNTDDLYRVTAVTPHSPASQAGIQVEDRILAIDSIPTAGRAHEEVGHQLRGPIGSAIGLRVLHPGMAQARDLHLHRALVAIPSVSLARDGDIAIFRITSFNHSTTQRIAEGLAQAQRDAGGKLGGIVLDVRNNPGGLLDQAVSLADLFVHDGPIVSTTGRNPASHQFFTASGKSIAPNVPIAVLVNGSSASAAEIVAAAIQDTGRGVVIGTSSYGKGTVQTVSRLPNDGDLIVTWARLITPSGYLLQHHGVVPTVCSASLSDDAASLQGELLRAGLGAGSGVSAPRARASLDENGWAALRRSCPPSHASPPADLKLAERIIADPKLYADALHALPVATRLAQGSPGEAAAAGLTDVNRALSSPER
ncbi:MAG TPA: S41 family peptidase [Stellaceae bacterium]|nr:S41 family peptidase [Stellaceae bacterium]